MHVLMQNGDPVAVAKGVGKLIKRAEAKAFSPAGDLVWNRSYTRLFRDLGDGRKRFTGLELVEVGEA